MKIYFKIQIISLLVICCQSSPYRDNTKIVTFDLKKLPEVTKIRLSELGFDNIEYVPLETNEKGLIQNRINLGSFGDKLLVGNSFFIIKHFNTILKFKDNGSFVAKIGTEGRAPNEFQACHDVETNDNGQNIYIVDGWKRKLFVYSESGDFINTINFPVKGFGYFRLIDDKFLYYNDNHLGNIVNSFNLIDLNGNIIKSFPNKYPFVKYKNDAYGYDHENLFYRFNNRLFKKEVYSDTIFSYDNMSFKPHMIIEVGEKLITQKARSEFPGMDLARNYITPRNLFEFGEYVYYEFMYKFDFSNALIYGFIGSKKNGVQVLINKEDGIINDLDGGPNIIPITIKDDNTIVGWYDAIQIKKYVDSEAFKKSKPKYPEKKKELEKMANSLEETDNPVLILVKLKK
jgi:hypothetical protein